jgi:UDP:flavonoid glycosyltransferase YjiC (YdhE family)
MPDHPTVYVTLGTTFADTPGLLDTVLDGVTTLDVNVIATVGRPNDAVELAARHPEVRVAEFVSQSLILPHCDAVVAHGGYGSLMGALTQGLPVVSIPVGAADNVPNALRLASLGAGVAVLQPDRSPQRVADALREVLDQPSYREAAHQIADDIASLPPPEYSATLLEELAATRAPVVSG